MGVLGSLYNWATTGGTRTTPTTSQKASGAVPGVPQGRKIFNDLLGLMSDALVLLYNAMTLSEITVNVSPVHG